MQAFLLRERILDRVFPSFLESPEYMELARRLMHDLVKLVRRCVHTAPAALLRARMSHAHALVGSPCEARSAAATAAAAALISVDAVRVRVQVPRRSE